MLKARVGTVLAAAERWSTVEELFRRCPNLTRIEFIALFRDSTTWTYCRTEGGRPYHSDTQADKDEWEIWTREVENVKRDDQPSSLPGTLGLFPVVRVGS